MRLLKCVVLCTLPLITLQYDFMNASFSDFKFLLDDLNEDCDFDKCGDKCVNWADQCKCGNIKFNIRESSQYCCVSPSDNCYDSLQWDGIVCPNGTLKKMSESCHGECYNDYRQSHRSEVGLNAHFAYNEGKDCLPVEEMCQGISFSDKDFEACSYHQIKCITDFLSSTTFTFKNPDNNTFHGHYYCNNDDKYRNNGKYDLIYRDDEEIFETQTYNSINYPSLAHCSDPRWYFYGEMRVKSSGIMHGKQCLWSYGWCRNENSVYNKKDLDRKIELHQKKRNYSEVHDHALATESQVSVSSNYLPLPAIVYFLVNLIFITISNSTHPFHTVNCTSI